LTHSLRGGGNDVTAKDVKRIIEDAGLVSCCQAVAELLTASLIKQDGPEIAQTED